MLHEGMPNASREPFGNCTDIRKMRRPCPKRIPIEVIVGMNGDFQGACWQERHAGLDLQAQANAGLSCYLPAEYVSPFAMNGSHARHKLSKSDRQLLSRARSNVKAA